MPTATRTATCPLCKDEFDDVVLYSTHLAATHGLIDDEGTETALPDVDDVEVGDEAEVAALDDEVAEPEAEWGADDLELDRERMVVVSTPERLPVAPAIPTRRVMAAPAWLVLVIVVQLLVGVAGATTVGNGSGDDTDGDTSSVQAAAGADSSTGARTEAAAPSVAPSTINPLLDQQLADQAVLRIGDLPQGWAVDADAGDLDPAEDRAALEATGQEACWASANAPIANEQGALAESGFRKDVNGVFSQVQVFSSEEMARLGVQAARNLMPCLADAIKVGIHDEGGELTLGAIQPLGFPPYGDESVAVTLQGTMIAPAIRVPLRVDGLIVRVDRTVVWVTTLLVGDALSQSDEKFLMQSLATRMAGEAA
jgi:hypothetical protein